MKIVDKVLEKVEFSFIFNLILKRGYLFKLNFDFFYIFYVIRVIGF